MHEHNMYIHIGTQDAPNNHKAATGGRAEVNK